MVKQIQRERAEQEQLIFYILKWDYLLPEKERLVREIIDKNPLLKLHRFKPFRAWYKYYRDREKSDPEYYKLLIASGKTPHEEDPYYDPKAPDWFDYHIPSYMRDDYEEDDDDDEYDDEDEDYDEYDDDDSDNDDDFDYEDEGDKFKKAAKDAFYFGIGYGIGSALFGGNSDSPS